MADNFLSAYFLGPKAENVQFLQDAISDLMSKTPHSKDICDNSAHHLKPTPPAKKLDSQSSLENSPRGAPYSRDDLLAQLDQLLSVLRQGTTPFFSPWYQAHTIPDPTLASFTGALAGLLCDVQARDAGIPTGLSRDGISQDGPAVFLENEIDAQLCRMMGLELGDHCEERGGWAHLTKSGTSANMEALWSAHAVKAYPLLLQHLISPGQALCFLACRLYINTPNPPKRTLLAEADPWTLVNLPHSEILSLPRRLQSEFGVNPKYLARIIEEAGLTPAELYAKHGFTPRCVTPSTAHYSWPKTASTLGFGSNALIPVPVGEFGRMRMDALKDVLEQRLEMRQPVFAVILMVGATPEGAVDCIDEVLEMRERFYERGMWFVVHVDAAYGGYFASMVRAPSDIERLGSRPKPDIGDLRPLVVRRHTLVQLARMKDVDSITVDPHKSGYCPYPSGGIVHKDARIRSLLRPLLGGRDFTEPASMTSLASVFLSHRVLGLHNEGHGYLLNDICWTSARSSAYLHTLSSSNSSFRIVPFSLLPSDLAQTQKSTREDDLKFIRAHIVGRTTEELTSDCDLRKFEMLSSLGGDLPINVFACNIFIPESPHSFNSSIKSLKIDEINGKATVSRALNRSTAIANKLNRRVYERFSMTSTETKVDDVPLFLTSTMFKAEDYGDALRGFKERLGLCDDYDDVNDEKKAAGETLVVLRQSVMSPFLRDEEVMKKCFEGLVEVVSEEAEKLVQEIEDETMKGSGSDSETVVEEGLEEDSVKEIDKMGDQELNWKWVVKDWSGLGYRVMTTLYEWCTIAYGL
ncbi:pyridoxal phosphate-dependent transferase [Panaeolus papilionaceus]|nr:pyridoxal phosphate-dependent transferase [Panaeolus papilionaceus]